MSENEKKLLEMVRNSKDPAKAIEIAVQIIVEVLRGNDQRTLFTKHPGTN